MRDYVDLHVHSFYSDGSLTPAQIAAAAHENGVGLLAVADHDRVRGSVEIREPCRALGIDVLSAVEIDTLDGRTNFHILAYDFDLEDPEFRAFLSHVRFLLDESSVKLIESMQRDGAAVSPEEYEAFAYDRRLGGWKALHYLMGKGITRELKEGIGLYSRYGLTYEQSGYPSIPATARRIHAAGGYAVLAHPGEVIDATDLAAFRAELERIAGYGVDGIECYYPSHTHEVTAACLDVCGARGLYITAGSDCHGRFGRTCTRVGEMGIDRGKVRLRGDG